MTTSKEELISAFDQLIKELTDKVSKTRNPILQDLAVTDFLISIISFSNQLVPFRYDLKIDE